MNGPYALVEEVGFQIVLMANLAKWPVHLLFQMVLESLCLCQAEALAVAEIPRHVNSRNREHRVEADRRIIVIASVLLERMEPMYLPFLMKKVCCNRLLAHRLRAATENMRELRHLLVVAVVAPVPMEKTKWAVLAWLVILQVFL